MLRCCSCLYTLAQGWWHSQLAFVCAKPEQGGQRTQDAGNTVVPCHQKVQSEQNSSTASPGMCSCPALPCPGSLFPILLLLVRLWGCFKAEFPSEDKLQMAIVLPRADGG